jgi:hypothetical protein
MLGDSTGWRAANAVRGQVEGEGSFAAQFLSEYLDEGMEDDE